MIVKPEIKSEADPTKTYTLSGAFGEFELVDRGVREFGDDPSVNVNGETRVFDADQVRRFGNSVMGRMNRLPAASSTNPLETEYTHQLTITGDEATMAGAGLARLANSLYDEMQQTVHPENIQMQATVAAWGAGQLLPGVELPSILIQDQE